MHERDPELANAVSELGGCCVGVVSHAHEENENTASSWRPTSTFSESESRANLKETVV